LNGKLSLAIQSGTEAPTWQSTVYEHRKLSDKKASLKMGWPPRDVKIVQGIGRHWKSLHNGRQHLWTADRRTGQASRAWFHLAVTAAWLLGI